MKNLFKTTFYACVFALAALTAILLADRFFINPGIKGISNTDLKHIGLLVGALVFMLLLVKFFGKPKSSG